MSDRPFGGTAVLIAYIQSGKLLITEARYPHIIIIIIITDNEAYS